KQRLGDIRDARLDIEDALNAPPEDTLIRNRLRSWIVAAIATVAFAVLAVLHFRQDPIPDSPEMRVEITTPSTQAPLEFALSPDSRYIVFAASGDGPQRLWLRALDKTEAQPIVGTEDGDYPFWSPDSRSIGFTASGKLKRVDIAGGPP